MTSSPGPTAPTPLTPEELADRIVPHDPRVSPDGSRVVFVAAPAGKVDERRACTLWIAGVGQEPRQLTAGNSDDRDPRWSPDGSRILFRSDRLDREDGAYRLFMLSLAGGEASSFGGLEGELSQPAWSPDGRRVAVLQKDPVSAEAKQLKKERQDAIVVEEAPRFTRLWIINAESEHARCLTTGEREVRSFGWTPDSQSLVTVTTGAVEYDATLGAGDLWHIPITGGLSRHVARFRTTPSSPTVVETGRGAIVAVRADDHREQPGDSIWTVPLDGGEPVNVLPDISGVVDEIIPLPGTPGKIAARIVERTHGRVYDVELTHGQLTLISPLLLSDRGSILDGVSFSNDGSRLAGIWSDSVSPHEVFLGDSRGDVSLVTTFGKDFHGRLQPSEHVTWSSDDGVEIEGLLAYPIGYLPGERYPLVVQVHGGPSWRWEDRVMLDWHDWAQMLASRGYAVLMPNPRGSTGYGQEFQRRLQDDVGGGESRDLVSGALAMVDKGVADPDRLGIAGWSWGGYLTAWTITQTDIFKAAVMGAGLSNMISDHGQGDIPSANLLYYPGQPYDHLEEYRRSSPIRYVSAVRTPTLILHGNEDARVHPARAMEFFRALKILGVPVRFVRYPREKHAIEERAHQIDLMNRTVEWLDRYPMNAKTESEYGQSAK